MITIPAGYNILNYIRDKSHSISSPCNGMGKCGKCKIRILSPTISFFDKESEVLSPKELDEGIRLACLHQTTQDTVVELIHPNNNMLIADNVLDQIEKNSYIKIIDHSIYRNGMLISQGDDTFGAIMDIGTTTCVIVLVNLADGQMIDSISFINPQVSYGHDVISRIGYASNPKGLSILHRLITEITSENISILLNKNKIDPSAFMEFIIAGNSTMNHLFMNASPFTMATAPYTPNFISKKTIKANNILNFASESAEITVLPGFDAFVGADILSGVYALNMIQSQQYQLLIDLGTNGEIVLGNREILYATSTAAGPAFEGINISCGMGAVEGALSVFEMSDENHFTFDTIGSKPCIGICGSGLIDIVASLKKQGIISPSGFMQNKFYVTEDIFITPKDIRQIQLAKAAIRAGIEVLINKASIPISKIDKVYISGGFGKYADINNIIDIGIIPQVLSDKISIVGNTSLSGTYKYLMSDHHNSINQIIELVNVVRLDANPIFMEAYINSMSF